MATKRKPGSRPGLIHCDYCGEDYSSSYRRCPFCADYDEYEEEYEPSPDRSASARSNSGGSGGKRLAQSNKRGGGYGRISPLLIILKLLKILISLAVIAAAVWIVVTQLMPLVQRGDNVGTIDPDTGPSQSASPSPGASPGVSPSASPDVSPGAGVQPDVTPSAVPSQDIPPSASASALPAATGFKLNKEDVTLESKGQKWQPRAIFTPEESVAELTWESDDPSIASVTEDGVVTAVGLGTTTISAMMPNGVTHACIVRCKWTETSEPSPSQSAGSGTPSETYRVNNPDFTFYRDGEQFKLRVVDYSGGVSWSSSNTGVATVSSDGTCTAVANGTCTVTGTLDDGTTVEAIVRVKIT